MFNRILVIALLIILAGCAHHPADCAIGVPWSDCLEGTAGYNNGGGSDTREQALKIEIARREGASAAASSPNATTSSPSKASTTDKLKELDSMHQQGLINDSEYANKKKAILDAM
jgi:hypothetical protein